MADPIATAIAREYPGLAQGDLARAAGMARALAASAVRRDDPFLRTLNQLRETADLTQQQVAGAADWSVSKVARIENGRTGVSKADLLFLCGIYGVTDQRMIDGLVVQARDRRARQWG